MTSVVQIGRHAARRLCTSESTAWCPVYEWKVNKFWHNYSMIICVYFSSFWCYLNSKCCSSRRNAAIYLFPRRRVVIFGRYCTHGNQLLHDTIIGNNKGLVIACISLLFNFVDVYQLLSSLVFYFFIVTGWMLLYRPRSRGSEVFWYDI